MVRGRHSGSPDRPIHGLLGSRVGQRSTARMGRFTTVRVRTLARSYQTLGSVLPIRQVSVARRANVHGIVGDREKTGTGYRTKDETMRAVGLFTHGGPEVLQVIELPEIHAGPGQVRIRFHAATVNPTDVGVRNGTRAEQQKADPPPYVPGMEAAGIVDEVGSGVPDRPRWATPSWPSWCRKAAMARIANKLCLMSDQSFMPLPERPILSPLPCR